MKLFSYIGSRDTQYAYTQKLLQAFLAELERQLGSQPLYIRQYLASDLCIEPCRGCVSCFRQGICPLDAVDSMERIKSEMLDADVIILGSPVYAAAVSGDMKSFIDRLSYWLHLMRLSGKTGVMLLTASSNSLMETGAYLRRIMESFGLRVVSEILCTTDVPNMLTHPPFLNLTIPQQVTALLDAVSCKTPAPSAFQEDYFKVLRASYHAPADVTHAEVQYWRASGMLACNTYSDYLKALSLR